MYVVRQLILIQLSGQEKLQLCHPQEVWLLCSPGIEVIADQNLGTFALVFQNIILHTFIQIGGSGYDPIETLFLQHVKYTKVYFRTPKPNILELQPEVASAAAFTDSPRCLTELDTNIPTPPEWRPFSSRTGLHAE